MRTVGTQLIEPNAGDLVAAVLTTRGWSIRELARHAHFDEKSLRKWKAAGVPARHQPRLRAFLEEARDEFTASRLERLLERYNFGHADLASRVDVDRSRVTRWLTGEPIPARAQYRLRKMESAAPNELWTWRRRTGLTRDQAAGRFGVSCGRIGQWERGDPMPSVHSARLEQLKREPTPATPGAALKARRVAAGLSGAQLGRLIGVAKSNIFAWESGTRAVPAAHRGALERALAVRARPREHDLAVLTLIGEVPGLRIEEIAQGVAPSHTGGVLGSLSRLVDDGRVVARVAAEGHNKPGQPPRLRRFYVPDDAPTAAPVPREFSGAELRRHRKAKGHTQASLAQLTGVSREAERAWEKAAIVPAHRRREILEALGKPPAAAPVATRARSLLPDLRDRRRSANLTQRELASRLGLHNGQAQVSAWEHGAPVSVERAVQIIDVLEAAAGDPPAPGGGELRDARLRHQTSRRQLAAAAGASPGTISRWEHGAPIPRRHWPAVRAVLEALEASTPRPEPKAIADLQDRRKGLGWNQRQLAAAAGVWQADITRWERGAAIPPATRERVEQVLATATPNPDPRGQAVVALVRAEPGLSAKAILQRRVGGNWATLRHTIAALVDDGQLHERPTEYQDATDRSRWRTGLHVGPTLTPQAPPVIRTGEDIVRLRTELQIPQAELARRLGLSPTIVWRWEHDLSAPNAQMIKTIERILMPQPDLPTA